MSRPHPFDLAFPDAALDMFKAVQQSHPENMDLTAFVRRQDVGELLDHYAPEESADPSTRGAMAHLLYIAFSFWWAGRNTVEVSPAADQKPATVPLWPPESVYLQLPLRIWWGQIAPDAPHEPIDGIWLAPNGDRLLLMAVLGLHQDRIGFSQIIAETDVTAWHAAREHVRTPPFAPLMDGGDRMQLKSVSSEAELFHLTQLALPQAAR